MSMRQKRLVRRVLSLAALVIVVVLVVTAVRRGNEDDTQTPAETGAVTDHDARYTSLTYDNGSATLSFALNEAGEWIWADLPEFPLNSASVEKILDLITGLQPQQTLTEPEDLEQYGLDDPTMTLTAGLDDGSALTAAIGRKASGDSGSDYLLLNGDESVVYIVGGELSAELSRGIYEMMVLPELPDIGQDRFRRVTVEAGETLTVCTAYAGAEGVPLSWRSGGANVTDSSVLKDLLGALADLTADACLDYNPSAEAVKLCGFESPAASVEVRYEDENGSEQVLTLTVGGLTVDGGSRCVRINEDATIYTMAADRLTPVLTVAAGGLEG